MAFTGTIAVPPGAGSVIRAEWDFESKGDFPVLSDVEPAPEVTVRASHSFAAPGTYFATLRAYSQRDGDTDTPYARIRNLGRARVIVK